MPRRTCRAEEGGEGWPSAELNEGGGRLTSALGGAPNAGHLGSVSPAAGRGTLLGGADPGRFGPLWEGSLPLALSSRLPGSGDAGSHFSAALIPGPLTRRGSVEPRSTLDPRCEADAQQSCSPPRSLDLSHLRAASPPRRLAFSACSFGVVRGSGNWIPRRLRCDFTSRSGCGCARGKETQMWYESEGCSLGALGKGLLLHTSFAFCRSDFGRQSRRRLA